MYTLATLLCKAAEQLQGLNFMDVTSRDGRLFGDAELESSHLRGAISMCTCACQNKDTDQILAMPSASPWDGAPLLPARDAQEKRADLAKRKGPNKLHTRASKSQVKQRHTF